MKDSKIMILWKTDDYRLMQLSTFRCNCFVLQYKGYNTLIDTSAKYEVSTLLKDLKRKGILHIDALVLTHNHFDHVANGARIQSIFGCPAYIEDGGVACLKLGRCSNPKGTGPWTKLLCGLISLNPFKRVKSLEPTEFHPYKEVRSIDDLETTGFLGPEVYILKTPGHTSDNISLILNNEVALVGDAVFNLAGMIYPPFADDEILVRDSWAKLLDTGCKTFYPSHGASVSFELLKKTYNEIYSAI